MDTWVELGKFGPTQAVTWMLGLSQAVTWMLGLSQAVTWVLGLSQAVTWKVGTNQAVTTATLERKEGLVLIACTCAPNCLDSL